MSSTDGVGTKSLIAQLTGRRDTIGIDLVAMSVDDIAVQGAEPLFFLDYISVGKLVPEDVDEIVSGVAEGCRQARCALLGGEMSEHPGIMEPGEFDLVGFAVGVVERSRCAAFRRQAGATESWASGARDCAATATRWRALRCWSRRAGGSTTSAWPGAHHDLAEELLRPSVIYAPAMQSLTRHVPVHAFAHITGGGIPGNLERVLPERCDGVVKRGVWEEPRIFDEIQRAGMVPDGEMEQVFNLGLGMLAIVPDGDELRAVDAIRATGHDSWVVGEIVVGHGQAHVER